MLIQIYNRFYRRLVNGTVNGECGIVLKWLKHAPYLPDAEIFVWTFKKCMNSLSS